MNDFTSRFDRLASEWDSNPVRALLARAVTDAIRRQVPLGSDWLALDFGAGTGLVSMGIAESVRTVTALDTSLGMTDELKRKLDTSGINNVRVINGNLFEMELAGLHYDLIFSSMALHHVENTNALLTRFHILLKPGGWLALADLDREDGSFHGSVNDVFHNGFNRPEIASALHNTGFHDVLFHNAHHLRKPDANGKLRGYSVFLVTARK